MCHPVAAEFEWDDVGRYIRSERSDVFGGRINSRDEVLPCDVQLCGIRVQSGNIERGSGAGVLSAAGDAYDSATDGMRRWYGNAGGTGKRRHGRVYDPVAVECKRDEWVDECRREQHELQCTNVNCGYDALSSVVQLYGRGLSCGTVIGSNGDGQ